MEYVQKVYKLLENGTCLFASAGEFGKLDRITEYLSKLPKELHGIVGIKLSQHIQEMAIPNEEQHKVNMKFWNIVVLTNTPIILDIPIFNLNKTAANWAASHFKFPNVIGATVRGDIKEEDMAMICNAVTKCKLRSYLWFNPKTTDNVLSVTEIDVAIKKVSSVFKKLREDGYRTEKDFSAKEQFSELSLGMLVPDKEVLRLQDIFPNLYWLVAGWRPPESDIGEHLQVSGVETSLKIKRSVLSPGRPISEPNWPQTGATTQNRVDATIRILKLLKAI